MCSCRVSNILDSTNFADLLMIDAPVGCQMRTGAELRVYNCLDESADAIAHRSYKLKAVKAIVSRRESGRKTGRKTEIMALNFRSKRKWT